MERADTSNESYHLGRWVAREDWPVWVFMAAIIAAAALIHPTLPDIVPTHYNIRGEADGFGGKATLTVTLPLVMLGLYGLLLVLPLIDPRRSSYPRFRSTLRVIRAGLVVFFGLLTLVTLAAAKGIGLPMGTAVIVLLSGMFILLGNFMGRIKPNWFMGIRTPWTLSSAEVWRRTHRWSGRAFVLAGLAGLFSILFAPETAFVIFLAAMLAVSVFCIAISYIFWRQEQARPRPPADSSAAGSSHPEND